MKAIRLIRTRLGIKLFISYVIVVLVGMLIMVTVVRVNIPGAYQRHIAVLTDLIKTQSLVSTGKLEQSLFENFSAGVTDAVLISLVVALIVAVIVALFISHQVVAPVQAMMEASQRIADGHYEERVEVSDDVARDELDELAQLALSFNQMAARLEQTETMRRQLIGDVAHELRTPLTAIMGSMEGLIDGVLAPETDTYIQIHHEAERMQRLVADLQELSRVEAGAFTLNRQLVSLSTIMDTLVSRIDRQYEEKGVQLETHLTPDLPVIWVDEDRFGQILINLVGNALQYTPSGGKVLLSAERQDKDILISVKDTGIGISPEDLDLIFTRFYRVEKSRSRSMGGSGIGLTIARHLVEAHGGRLWAESAGIGQGSIFYITIPTTMPEA